MFFSQLFLSKKGALGPIWIAAHLERRLNKKQVFEVNIPATVDTIIHPDVPIALRLSGHLLLGVVRVYSRKVTYVLEECEDAKKRLKTFTRRDTDLPPEAAAAPFASITLPPQRYELEELVVLEEPHLRGIPGIPAVSTATREQITLPDAPPAAFDVFGFDTDERLPPVEEGPDAVAPAAAQRLEDDGMLPPVDIEMEDLLGARREETEKGREDPDVHPPAAAAAAAAAATAVSTEEAGTEGLSPKRRRVQEGEEGGLPAGVPLPPEGPAAAAGEEEQVEMEVMRAAATPLAQPAPGSPGLALRPEMGSSGVPVGGTPLTFETPVFVEVDKEAASTAGTWTGGSLGPPSTGSPGGAFVTPDLAIVSPIDAAAEEPRKRGRTESGIRETTAGVAGAEEGAAADEGAAAAAAAAAAASALPAAAGDGQPGARRPPRPQRKRKSPVDAHTVIPSEQMREQLQSVEGIMRVRSVAPHTALDLDSQRLESLPGVEAFQPIGIRGLGQELAAFRVSLVAPRQRAAALEGGRPVSPGQMAEAPAGAEDREEIRVAVPGSARAPEGEGEPRGAEPGGGADGEAAPEAQEMTGVEVVGQEPGDERESLRAAAEQQQQEQEQQQQQQQEQEQEGAPAVASPVRGQEGPQDVVDGTPAGHPPATPFSPGSPFSPFGFAREEPGQPEGVLGAAAGVGAEVEVEVMPREGEGSLERRAPAEPQAEEGGEEGGRRTEARVGDPGSGLDLPGLAIYKPPQTSLEFLLDRTTVSEGSADAPTGGRKRKGSLSESSPAESEDLEAAAAGGGWSVRTRGAMRLLKDSFAAVQEDRAARERPADQASGEGVRGTGTGGHSPPALSLLGLVEDCSRKAAARLFFETLVLTTRACVEVKQQVPYGDVGVLARDPLMRD